MDGAKMGALVDLVTALDRAGVQELVADGDQLRYRPRSALTPDLAQRLKTHKDDLLALLRPAGPLGAAVLDTEGDGRSSTSEDAIALIRWDDCSPLPDPCSRCGALLSWWNPLGERRCMACDPPTSAIRMLEKTERIRRRRGVPMMARAAEMLADLRRLTRGHEHRPIHPVAVREPVCGDHDEIFAESMSRPGQDVERLLAASSLWGADGGGGIAASACGSLAKMYSALRAR